MTIRIPPWLATFVLAVLMLAVYWAGLHGGFFFDDGPSILHAPGLRMTELSWASLEQAWSSGGAGPTGRPLAQLTFALNHFFSGYSPFAFKLSNLGIHGLGAVLVYAVARELLTSPNTPHDSKDGAQTALFIAALWALHPLQLLPVLHVVQRMTSLAALFLLAAFWLHIVARRQDGAARTVRMLLAWLVAWPLAILSKETALLFPVFVLAWELLLRPAATGRLDRFAKIYTTLSIAVAVGVVVYLLSPGSRWIWAGYEFRSFDWVQRLLTEARVLWFYVGLALLPRWSAYGLYHDDLAISTDWLTPASTLPAGLAWVAVLLLIGWTRRREPLIAFGLTWFLVGHLMESTVLPLEIAHEHRNYLPLLGLLLAVTVGLLRGLEHRVRPKSVATIGVLAVLLCATVTALRAHQYGDDLRRTLAEAQHHPESARAQYEAGMVVSSLAVAAEPASEAYKVARAYLERATAQDPNFKIALLDILELDCKAGRGVNQLALEELARRLRATLFAPGDRNLLYHLKEGAIAGQFCLSPKQVVVLFDAARANPGVAPTVAAMLYSWQADYHWLHGQDLPAAKEALARSLDLNPGNASSRLKWAQLLWLAGERPAARALLLELRSERLVAEERRILEQLLAAGNIVEP